VESVPAGADRESIGKSEVERQSVRRKSWNSPSTFASKKVCQMILKSWLVSTSSLFNQLNTIEIHTLQGPGFESGNLNNIAIAS
jgi:hypothetical protein